MHELSLAGASFACWSKPARDPFERVTQLRLQAGALCGVELSALRFAREAIAPGTCLAQAQTEIDEPQGSAWCMDCSQSVAILSRLDPCPLCDGHQLQATGGAELRVVDMQVV